MVTLGSDAPWNARHAADDLIAELAHDLALSELTARMLVARGIDNVDDGKRFLSKRLKDLHRPELMADMTVAAKRLAHAIEQRQNVLIHGDYDVDGSTATTLIKHFCQACSHDATGWIPHRVDDGYGLTENSLQAVKEHQAELMITVDCGIADNGWAARIEAETGCHVIITDHHLPQAELPNCTAVCNPNRPDCNYPDKGLAGVGVAWKLCWATATVLCGSDTISERLRAFLLDGLALVAVGTVADCAPMRGENRALVHHGLQALAKTRAPGLRALLRQARCDSGEISAGDIGWKIGPLLNASGRLDTAMRNIHLLCASNDDDAESVMAEVVEQNDERRRLSQMLTDDLIAEVESQPEYQQRAALVFAGEGWHPGVVGIVASRLVDRFAKPACVIAIEDGRGRGSLRTVPGVHLGHAIDACRGHLLSGGGHAAAAGLAIEADAVPGFIDAFNAFISQQHPGGPSIPAIDHDGRARIDQLDPRFFAELDALAPFGIANPEPVVEVVGATFAGRPQLFGRNGDHLRGALTDAGGAVQDFLAWRGGSDYQTFAGPGRSFNLLVKPQIDTWRGERRHRLVFVDGRLT